MSWCLELHGAQLALARRDASGVSLGTVRLERAELSGLVDVLLAAADTIEEEQRHG